MEIDGERQQRALESARSHHLAPQDFSIHVKLFTQLEQAVVMAVAGESGKLPEC